MFEIPNHQYLTARSAFSQIWSDHPAWAIQRAHSMYRAAASSARWGQLWARLRHKPCTLLDLSNVTDECSIDNRTYLGVQPVPLHRIQGSECRSTDFDQLFRPLCRENQARWVNIAIVSLMDISLPAVDLIQVGDVYFVRDGHHRISVARALDQESIDAEVTLWVVEALPEAHRQTASAAVSTAAISTTQGSSLRRE